ncbi:hypothetical protein SAMN02745166_04735 [Prosthecobacter debontii]|uniref:Uncharacterized protein n=1 Tax=Prosthecobacter debontii TaxID=48467 RepID=A0A1T4Z164_9BACT|nr:hypothetical protein SAMN02745166_04735 [Prosthecobacter debontii]
MPLGPKINDLSELERHLLVFEQVIHEANYTFSSRIRNHQ